MSYKVALFKLKMFCVLPIVVIIIVGRYGIPYMFEKYGMPGEAVIIGLGKDSHGNVQAHYEFYVDGKPYRGGVRTDFAHQGDTVRIWYFLEFPWLNKCDKNSIRH